MTYEELAIAFCGRVLRWLDPNPSLISRDTIVAGKKRLRFTDLEQVLKQIAASSFAGKAAIECSGSGFVVSVMVKGRESVERGSDTPALSMMIACLEADGYVFTSPLVPKPGFVRRFFRLISQQDLVDELEYKLQVVRHGAEEAYEEGRMSRDEASASFHRSKVGKWMQEFD